jgi:hypothetical protein
MSTTFEYSAEFSRKQKRIVKTLEMVAQRRTQEADIYMKRHE